MNSTQLEHNLETFEKNKQKSQWTLDYIIQHIFPILGILMMVGGIGYFFYTGFWGNISETARLGIGFFLGASLIAGGYSFSKELKTLGDNIIGGGILTLYITLIYGSRTDVAQQLQSAIFPESFALIVSALFCLGIVFYSIQRNSKIILMLGMLGAYLTPFFIGEIGSFDYQTSFIGFLLYFLAISSALFFASFRMNLLSLLTVNILGLFIGTLSLSGLMQGGFNEQPEYSLLISFAIIIAHLSFVVVNIKKFSTDKIVSSVHFVLPFLWFFTIVFEAVDSSFYNFYLEFSLGGILMALLSGFYFILWNFLERKKIKNENLQAGIYAIGFIAGGIAFFDIAHLWGKTVGLILSAISLLFAYLFYRNKQHMRELAYLGIAGVGTFLVFSDFYSSHVIYWIFHKKNILLSLSLIPFLLHWILPKGKEGIYTFREILAFISIALIAVFLGSDIIMNIDISFSFIFFIPAIIFAYRAISLSNKNSKKSAHASVIFTLVAYFISFFIFWDNIFPAHRYTFFETEDSFLALFSLFILGSLLFWVKKNIEKMSSGFHFFLLLCFVTIIFQLVSNEIIAVYNFFVPPADVMAELYYLRPLETNGVIASLVSFWWVVFSALLLVLGIKDAKKFPFEKSLGMIMLIFTFVKIFLYDLINIDVNIKVFLFMIVGGILLGISYFLHVKKNKVSLDEK